ncbi:hypothetical protein G6F56_003404 [Rhizopus delemar]|uniref:Uncharacterized protein n=1 Tax=Rhizopus stolonifer TaxID=4846 RepID=A0A367KML3_RHIST|nr:hypothetical protein G6F56_003404 [Rhizopus delemar]RCI03391.1 hypothetical protein CU098_004365 [Rhizopus stolonifer]
MFDLDDLTNSSLDTRPTSIKKGHEEKTQVTQGIAQPVEILNEQVDHIKSNVDIPHPKQSTKTKLQTTQPKEPIEPTFQTDQFEPPIEILDTQTDHHNQNDLENVQNTQLAQCVEIPIEGNASLENSEPIEIPSGQVEKNDAFLESLQTLEIAENETAAEEQRSRISLRKRKDIQLHPFTIEKYKFKSMFHGTSIRRMVTSIEPQNTQDQSDTEFVPGTEEGNQTLDYAYTQSALEDDTQRADKLIIERSAHKPVSSLGLEDRGKKIVTYSKRKRNKVREPILQQQEHDIFAFDPNPSFVRPTQNTELDALLGDFEDILERAPQSKRKQMDKEASSIFDLEMNTDRVSVDNESEEEEPVFFRRKRLRRRIDIEDEEDDEENEEEDKDYSIFDFPDDFESLENVQPGRTLSNKANDDNDHDLVSFVEDDLEDRPTKKRRNKVADLRRNKNILKGVLPASFLNVYQRELNEEEKNRSAQSKRTLAVAKEKRQNAEERSSRLDEPFDAFLGSQSNYMENEQPEEHTHNDQSQISVPDSESQSLWTRPHNRRTIQPRIDNYTSDNVEAIEDNRTFQYYSRTSSSKKITQPKINHYLSSNVEAMEDNRVFQSYNRAPTQILSSKRQTQNTAYRSTHRSSQKTSQRATQKASQTGTKAHIKKRRKVRKKTMDDIYVHQYQRIRPHISNIPINRSRYRTLDDIDVSSKRTYNDDHTTVRKPPVEWVQNMAEFLRTTKNAAILKPLPKYTHSLEQVVERLQRIFDPDLRCSSKLKDTVYLNHRLLQPLLSTQPNSKRAYAHLKTILEQPVIFRRNVFWPSINPKQQKFVESLFQHANREITKVCSDIYLETSAIPDLDTFYVFVSVYLTQWLPLQDPTHVMIMTEVFGQEIRRMANRMCFIVKTRLVESWHMVVKTMLFVLDWTCRLHLIGVNELEWSVTKCTQMLIDILVTIGHECIETQEKPYVIEAWICLLQIMTVSSNSGGYYFSDEVFMRQLRHSISHKKSKVGWIVNDTPVETWWTNALYHILEKYML